MSSFESAYPEQPATFDESSIEDALSQLKAINARLAVGHKNPEPDENTALYSIERIPVEDEGFTLSRRGFLQAGVAGATAFLKQNVFGETEPAAPEQVMRPRPRERVIEINGRSLAELARQSGCEMRLKIDNGDGPFILHIHQNHEDFEHDTSKGINETIRWQERIKNFLLQIASNVQKPLYVFSEGFESSDHAKYLALYNIRQEFDQLQPSSDVWLRLAQVYQKRSEQSVLGRTNRLFFMFCLLLGQTIERIERQLQQIPPMYSLEQQRFFTQSLSLRDDLKAAVQAADTIFHPPSPLYWGAELNLYLDGKVVPLSAETIEGNIKGFAAWKKYEIAAKEFNAALARGTDKKIRQKLWKEVLKIKPEMQRKTYHDREMIACGLIRSHPMARRERFVPLIFGDAHDFTTVLSQQNQKLPLRKFGLIEIIPSVPPSGKGK